jgi:hypothetical protein
MKAEANRHFLQGVNQLIGHGWPYSPETVPYPGWRFYAAGVFNEKNPWWIVMPEVTLYLQRASYLLRQGSPVNDVAFYLPVSDAYASFTPGYANLIESLRRRVGPEAVGAVLDAGFNFDFIDDDVLRRIGRIENGSLILGSIWYRVVVLPNVERIPPDTYRTLAGFVGSGGRLIASRRRPGRTSVALQLEPYQSRFLVFSGHTAGNPVPGKLSEESSLDLSEGWRVKFEPSGVSKTMERLTSWIEDEDTRHFSGVAVYEKEVIVPESMLKPGAFTELDFGGGGALVETRRRSSGMRAWFEGPVREAAVVYVNGRRAGTVWSPPYSVEVTGLLKRGGNRIRILVANTAVNHMAGRSLPDYRLLIRRYGRRFDPQDMDRIEPVPSGLLGPIRLVAFRRESG